MKKTILSIILTCGIFFGSFANVSAQEAEKFGNFPVALLNEIESNPPGSDGACEYAELRGRAGTLLENVYFLNVTGNQFEAGQVASVINLSGQLIGTNGLLVISRANVCANRILPAETTQILTNSLSLRNASASFLLVSSPTAITPGTDLDTNDDGTLDLPEGASVIDGIGWTDGFSLDFVYGARLEGSANTPDGEAPDAATRFPYSFAANSSEAWYLGDLTGENSSVTYDPAVVSGNFPQGGVLTPGAPNAPFALQPKLQCVVKNGRDKYRARFGYENENGFVINIAVGDDNRFFPGPADRGQTTAFQPGEVENAFEVGFEDYLLWTVKGSDGITRIAFAWKFSPRCQ